jgi:hypothetical protein
MYCNKNTINTINASHAIKRPYCSENQLFPQVTYLVFNTKSRNKISCNFLTLHADIIHNIHWWVSSMYIMHMETYKQKR